MADELFPGGEPSDGLPEGLDFGNDVIDDDAEVTDEPEQRTDESAADDTDADDADAGGADEQSDADGTDAGADDATDEESAPSDEEAEPEPVKGKQPLIPKARLDQALRKQRAAEQRAQEIAEELATLRAEQAKAAAPKPISDDEIKAKMAAANEALVAGDTERAAALQAEVFAALTPQPHAAPAELPNERDLASEVAERLAFNDTLADVNARFPELDENSDAFSEEASEEAVELQKSYIRRGYNLSDATRKAAEAVSKLYDLADRKATPVPDKRVTAAKTEQAAKSREKIEKATRAAPPMTGRSDKSDDVAFDINKASMEEFMALPESVRERLLGNTI